MIQSVLTKCHSYHGRDANFEKMSLFRLETQKCKKEQNKKKNTHQFLGNVNFPYVRATISVMWRRQKKGENGALYRDGFCECVFYQGEKPNFDKEAILTKT